MKYLKQFANESDFQAFKEGEDFVLPNVSWVVENNSVMFESLDPINIDDYLTIYALEDGLTVSLPENSCEYCVNGNGSWKTLSAGSITESINAGQTLSFRGECKPIAYANGIGTFVISKKCNLLGNSMSIIYGDEGKNNFTLPEPYVFNLLFKDCVNIVSVCENFLPATTLTSGCYDDMFAGCSSLINAPKLPAIKTKNYCYRRMFVDCTSLEIAPELPATGFGTGVQQCYEQMFKNCISLTAAPKTILACGTQSCKEMFMGCISLTTAPESLSTGLYNSCYLSMFQGCTSLTTAPELPATNLQTMCYYGMFWGCTSLITAPELPATSLKSNCYSYMFKNCSKLNYIKTYAYMNLSGALTNWVDGVSTTGTFVKKSSASFSTGVSGIPEGWTVEKL